jgi:hypothetical protein
MEARNATSQAKINVEKLKEGEDKSEVLSQAGDSFSQNARHFKISKMKWKDVSKNLKNAAITFRTSQTPADFTTFETALAEACEFMARQDIDKKRVLNAAERQKQILELQAYEQEVKVGYAKTKFKFLQPTNTLDAIEQAAKKEDSEVEYSSPQNIAGTASSPLTVTVRHSASEDEISSPSIWATLFCCDSKDKRRERSVSYHASTDYTRLRESKGPN